MAEIRTTQVEESKEMAELWDAFAVLAFEIKKALADGFQPATDIPTVLLNSFNNVISAVDGVQKIPAEVKENLPEFIMANAVGAGKVTKAVLK